MEGTFLRWSLEYGEFSVTRLIHSRLQSTMVMLYFAIRQASPNFRLPEHYSVVDMQPEDKPSVYNRRPGWQYQILITKGKQGRRFDLLIESLAVLDEKPVKLISGNPDIRTVLDVVGNEIDKYINNARAQGGSYEHLWQRREDSYPVYEISFPTFPECSAKARASFKSVQMDTQIWWTVHEWEWKD
jgi:hypothetical protein